MTSSGQPIEARVEELEVELEVLRSRNAKPPYRRWQIQLYVLILLAIGIVPGLWITADATHFIPELVNGSAPLMLLLGVMTYGYATYELRRASEPTPMTVTGNWYLAAAALILLTVGAGLLLVDKTRFALMIALIADTLLLVVIIAHPVVSVWRRHS
jgi:hypothetical protein